MAKLTVKDRICRCIEEMPIGEPFSAAEFLDLGTRARVSSVLGQIAKTDLIMRVTRGVFVRPKINPYVGAATSPHFQQQSGLESGSKCS